jgi:short-subunit dehydrogenase
MEKSVAIVTGASQGISRSTAIRLACDLSALVLVARGRTNLESHRGGGKAAGAQALSLDMDLAHPNERAHGARYRRLANVETTRQVGLAGTTVGERGDFCRRSCR